MMQPDRHTAWNHLGFQLDPLIGTAMIGMLHDVAGRLVHRQLEVCDVVLIEKPLGNHAAEFADEFAGAAEILEVAANLQLGARQRSLRFADFHGDAGQVVDQPIGLRKRHGGLADGIHERFRLELAVDPNELREAVGAEQLAVAVAHFGDPVRVEEKQVSRLERDGHLIEDLSFADSQRQVVPVQRLAPAGAGAHDHHPRVPAIDEVEDAPIQVQSGVTQRHEALEIDQLPNHVRVGQRHDFLGLRKRAIPGHGHEMAQRFEEVALGRPASSAAGMPLPMTSATITSRHWFSCLKKS